MPPVWRLLFSAMQKCFSLRMDILKSLCFPSISPFLESNSSCFQEKLKTWSFLFSFFCKWLWTPGAISCLRRDLPASSQGDPACPAALHILWWHSFSSSPDKPIWTLANKQRGSMCEAHLYVHAVGPFAWVTGHWTGLLLSAPFSWNDSEKLRLWVLLWLSWRRS